VSPTNAEIAEALARMADLLEVEDEQGFRVRAYRNAAETIEDGGAPPLAEMHAAGGDLSTLDDIGKGIAARIGEMIERGPMDVVRAYEREKLPGALELLRVPGLGPKRVRKLRATLGLTSLDDLRSATRDGRLARVPGFGAKTIEGIARRLDKLAGDEAAD